MWGREFLFLAVLGLVEVCFSSSIELGSVWMTSELGGVEFFSLIATFVAWVKWGPSFRGVPVDIQGE